jgi:hypothetical protein
MFKNGMIMRKGIFYCGIIHKGQASFTGSNSDKTLHGVQNYVHRSWPIKTTEYFPNRNLKPKSYTYSGSYHPNYLYF